jgi:hypothetical protein
MLEKGKNKELLIFRRDNMVIAYNRGGWCLEGSEVPGYQTMSSEDRRLLDKALSDHENIALYFLKEEDVPLGGRYSSKVSPRFGEVIVEDENGPAKDLTFVRSVIDGPVVCIPLEVLPFIMNSFSNISAMVYVARPGRFDDFEVKQLARLLSKF